MQKTREDAVEARIAGPEEIRILTGVLGAAKELESEAAAVPDTERRPLIKKWFSDREKTRKREAGETGERLTRAFAFLEKTFGEGQEIVIFLTELSAGRSSLRFISECGNEAYYRFNRMLLLKDKQEALKAEVLELLDEM